MYLEPKGRNWGDIVNWDDLGKLYAGFTIGWTVILTLGIAWLIVNRHLPHIRIRNLPLAIASTFFLHVYLVKILLAYTTNGHFLCSAEYWIMSIYLPFGIALFQAYLTQLRSVWEQQQKLLHYDGSRQLDNSDTKRTIGDRWRALSRLHKSYCYIGIGMVLQLILTSTLYAETPTLQGDWSSYGKITHAKGQALCRKSLPWVTSAFWQLFWSWIYGPYTLFKVRNIHDIHYWKFQVTVSVVAGLPGTPLWLASLYLIQFKPVNIRFVPPMWLAPGIIIIQLVTIFVPVFETWSSRRLTRSNVSRLLSNNSSDVGSSYYTSNSGSSSKPSMDKYPAMSQTSMSQSTSTIESRMYSMHALRSALTLNHKLLLEFAATKEFSAENILFLTRVQSWRSVWTIAAAKLASPTQIPAATLKHLFNIAVDIYIDLVNEATAEFSINLDFNTRKALDAVFEPTAILRNGRSQRTSNAFDFTGSFTRMKAVRTETSDSERTLIDKTDAITRVDSMKDVELADVGATKTMEQEAEAGVDVVVPPEFTEDVFDNAVKSIEYLVLTNTWPKFVKLHGLPQQ